MGNYYVYILASHTRVIYIGVTNDLRRRLSEHRFGGRESFVTRYNCDRLVHYERFEQINFAIKREKQLKGWTRAKKIALIERQNPQWVDLAVDWFKPKGRA